MLTNENYYFTFYHGTHVSFIRLLSELKYDKNLRKTNKERRNIIKLDTFEQRVSFTTSFC